MKHFFYTILVLASLVAVGIIFEPSLFHKGAALIGLELPQFSSEPDVEKSSEDQLAQFLAQYPLTQQNSTGTLPATDVPMVVIPEPVQPAMPPIYSPADSGASAAGTGLPAFAPVNDYADALTLASANAPANYWDGELVTPINAEPSPSAGLAERQFPPPPTMDWSGSTQPAPAPQQSVYAHHSSQHGTHDTLSPDPFSTANNVAASDLARMQPMSQQTAVPLQVPPPNKTIQSPAVLTEDVPVYGTEMAARVGRQIILLGDILPKLRRKALQSIAEKFRQMPEQDRAKVSPQDIEKVINFIVESGYPDVLQEQILFALVYSDFDMSKSKDEKNFLYDKLGGEFDSTVIPDMMKEFNVENVAALKKFLEEQLGSSLEKEKRLWVQEQIAKHWVSANVQRATGDCTHEEMKEFYDKNQAMFTSPAKARWQEMVVLLSKHATEQEAFKKISWMGNQVAGGAPFEKIAEVNSDGFTASKGGIWDWTTKEDLASPELVQAIFTQPLGQLSTEIIKSNSGLHIVRVLERQIESVVPFIEAQGKIREEIKTLRAQRYQNEFFAELRRRYPTQIIKQRIDFSTGSSRTANTR